MNIDEYIEERINTLNNHEGINNKIGECIGRGSYGFVCKWNDGSNDEMVIKIIDTDYQREVLGEEGFDRESSLSQYKINLMKENQLSEMLAWTQNLHLMLMMDSPHSIEGETDFIVMPKLVTLQDSEIPVSQNDKAGQVIKILKDCCEGLHVLHTPPEIVFGTNNGLPAMIHGDLKPNNIFWDNRKNKESYGCYIIGDYSCCYCVDSLKPIREKHGTEISPIYEIELENNPYRAPEISFDQRSDIWSLGWILWYWMHDKKHPYKDDILNRYNNDESWMTKERTKAFKDYEYLWEVFLKMTNPDPEERYDSVKDLIDALENAAKKDNANKAEVMRKQGHTEGSVDTAAVIAMAALTANAIGKIKDAFNPKTDAENNLHGEIQRTFDLSNGGRFKGEWVHGIPRKGTYTSTLGNKKNGTWEISSNHCFLFNGVFETIFAGILLDTINGLLPYDGEGIISLPEGELKIQFHEGSISEGIMKFSDGREKKGLWKFYNDEHMKGFYIEEILTGCGEIIFSSDKKFVGSLWEGKPGIGKMEVSDSTYESTEGESFMLAWNISNGIFNCGGNYEGSWCNGAPDEGKYIFSNGTIINGKFSYEVDIDWLTRKYSGMVLEGKPCGWGTFIIDETMKYCGEFLGGKYHGMIDVSVIDRDGQYHAKYDNGLITQGTLILADGSIRINDLWNEGKLVTTNYSFEGIYYLDKKNRLTGIGKYINKKNEEMFTGILIDDYGIQ